MALSEADRPAAGKESAASPIGELLAARARHSERWGTLDAQTLELFQGIFQEVGGRGKRFLEVGSGNGFTCVLFALLGAREVRGLEVVPEAVATAEEVKRQVDPALPVFFRQGNAADPLSYPDGSFDVVLLIEVVSHVVAPDLTAFFREIVRVLAPGGLLYLQDGNNARSWMLRRKNYEIWERFEKGPPTSGGETVHTHRVGTPYVEARREIAGAAVPSLSPDETRAIAEGTFGFAAEEVRSASRRYRETGALPESRFRRKVCPVEPVSRMYIEQLVDPFEVGRILRRLGCEILACRQRRRLPFDRFWRAVPALTMMLTNGFTLIARKK